jgi:hypothetical protein
MLKGRRSVTDLRPFDFLNRLPLNKTAERFVLAIFAFLE